MQLATTILEWLRQGKTPQFIAKEFSSQSGILNKSQQAEILSQSQQAIDYVHQLSEKEEAKKYLLTLFHIYTHRDERITLRVLGEVIENPAYSP